jgi:uncharacterized protein (TIGR02246 family)
MKQHPIEHLIEKADTAINQEDFDTLIDIYSDDAVLVVKPGMNVSGKVQIRKAFEAIAAFQSHTACSASRNENIGDRRYGFGYSENRNFRINFASD